MNIGEFTALDREAQFAEAGRIAGVPPSVFDGIWRTESGRGANMLSKAGAEGHFQLMPQTRASLEKRFGTTVDPYNFGQSLYAAAELMRENMGRFKNVPDALRAYNGGWDPAKWGNLETSAYAGKVLGENEANASTAAAAVGIGKTLTPVSEIWDAPFKRATRMSTAKTATSKAVEDLARIGGAPAVVSDEQSFRVFGQSSNEAATRELAAEQLKEDTSFGDAVMAAGYRTVPVLAMQALFRDPEPVDPNFTASEEDLKGYSLAEQRELAGATSAKQLNRIKSDIEYGKEQDAITFRNGTLFGLAASLIASAPEAMLTGGIASLAFRGAGVGATVLARSGDYTGAMLSATAEGVVGNVLNTAALDMLGERQGVNAYAIGAAGGLINPILQGKYLGRLADAHADTVRSENLVRYAADQEAILMDKAARSLPEGYSKEDLKVAMNRMEAEGYRAEIASHKSAIPETRKMYAGASDEVTEDAVTRAAAMVDEVPTSATPGLDAIREAVGDLPQARPVLDAIESMVPRAPVERPPAITPQVQGKSVLEAADWATQNVPERLVPIASRAATQLRELEAAGMKIGKVDLDPNLAPGVDGAARQTLNRSGGSLGTVRVSLSDAASAETLTHEIFHAATTASIKWGKRSDNAGTRIGKATKDLDVVHKDFMKHLDARFNSGEALSPFEQAVKDLNKNAAQNAEESLTWAMTNREMQDYLTTIPYKQGTLWDEFVRGVRKLLGMDASQDTMLSEYLRLGGELTDLSAQELRVAARGAGADEIVRYSVNREAAAPATRGEAALAKEIREFLQDPEVMRSGLDRLPMNTATERAEAKEILALYKKSRSPEYQVDEKRLSALLNKVDALNPTSNMMLRSKNPILRMAAIELLENGGGAAGRRSTAAIAKYMNERTIVGDAIVVLDTEFNLWFKGQSGASNMSEAFTGRKRAEFNRIVAEEIEQRRYSSQQSDFGQNVRAAADSLEAAFERARLMQVDAKTAGWAALPPTSKGYMPHRMKSLAYRNMTLPQKRALHNELTNQFVEVSNFDPAFADRLASKYLDRIEQRALGGFDAPMGMHQTGAADVIRESLEQMNMTRTEIDAMMKRHIAGAAAHTKKRLNIDLRRTINADDGTSFSLLDLYDTDMLSLLRGQSQRVGGEVALARHGVMGKPGLAIIRRAAGYGEAGEQALAKEVGAFDQVSAEFLGQPFGETNKWVDRTVQFNSISSLGGMGFNQLGEQINVAATLGVKAALSNVAAFGRLRSEILALARGEKVDNAFLNSIETMSGTQFGTDAYKMVFPMDNPDLFANSMGADSITAGDRLLRGAGHLQGKLSLWRAIHSTQVRGVAEQIVLKAAKAMKAGAGDFHLRDMGIDDDVITRLRKDIDKIVQVRDGNISYFDITQATDKEAAHSFIQGVHRGASQIIQGTFIGESGKYVHSSWLRMLTQFRSFSLTAIDKQWNRQLGNRGATGAIVLTLAAMSVAAPIYMARTYLASIGRKDREEYLEKQLSFGAIARASTNYIATSGLAGDFVDLLTATTGTAEFTGGRSGTATTAIGNLVAPAAGKVDRIWGALQNTREGTDPHALLKEMPLSRLPFLIPAANALGD